MKLDLNLFVDQEVVKGKERMRDVYSVRLPNLVIKHKAAAAPDNTAGA